MKKIDTSSQTFKEVFSIIKENLEELEFKLNNNGCRYFSEAFVAEDKQEFFPLSHSYTVNNNCCKVFKNGIRQFLGSGFYETTTYQNKQATEWLKENGIGGLAGTYFFTPPCHEGDILVVEYKEVFPVADNIILTKQIDENIETKTTPIIQSINDLSEKLQNDFTEKENEITNLLNDITLSANEQKTNSENKIAEINNALEDLATFKNGIVKDLTDLALMLNLKKENDLWTEIIPKLKDIQKTNVKIAVEDWIEQEDASLYPSQSEIMLSLYPYIAEIPIEGVTENHSSDIRFSSNDVISGKFSNISLTVDGFVRVYSAHIPENEITIPVIICNAINI